MPSFLFVACLTGGLVSAAKLSAAAPLTPFVPNDPYYFTNSAAGLSGQWHLHRQSSGALVDINVAGAWSRGWTGDGVTMMVTELAHPWAEHADLSANFVPELRLLSNWPWSNGSGHHATAVAGVAVGRGGNGIGITGVAPLGRFTSSSVDEYGGAYGWYEIDFLASVNHRNDVIAVKNYSMGAVRPFDRYSYRPAGATLDWEPDLRTAYVSAESQGAILVLGAANYRQSSSYPRYYGNANAFVDKNDPGIIVVAGVGSDGTFAHYSNHGSNITVAAPTLSSKYITPSTVGITTTALTPDSQPVNPIFVPHPDPAYTAFFSGTSSATPVVSGVMTLGRQANPNLSGRFAKHLLARTSQRVDPLDASSTGGWVTNAAGISFNNNYGFGLIDASSFVTAAQRYSRVTPYEEVSSGYVPWGGFVPALDPVGYSFTFPMEHNGLMEEAMLTLSMRQPTGTLQQTDIELISPSGTRSVLQYATPDPVYWSNIFDETWTWVSNAFYGEPSAGIWTAVLRNPPGMPGGSMRVWGAELQLRTGTLIEALPGDTNFDDVVDFGDLLALAQNYGGTIGQHRGTGDFTGDGRTEFDDLLLLAQNYADSSSFESDWAHARSLVPEPATMAVGLVWIGLLARRR